MLPCRLLLVALVLLSVVAVKGFVVVPAVVQKASVQLANAETMMTIEVCNGKDCKRGGGGPRLEKLIATVLEEKDMQGKFSVEKCDCQGECGYGPNLLLDGKMNNRVKGRAGVLKALGLEPDEEEKS